MQSNRLEQAGQYAEKLPGLMIEAERVASTFMKGLHGRRRSGSGDAFWQFRPYDSGDTPRDIDWKQSARQDGDVLVRQREWEAAQTVWLYRDSSGSMNYHSRKGIPKKQDYADVLLLATGLVLLNGGEQISLLGTDLAPQPHEAAIHRILEFLPHQTHLQETARPVQSHAKAIIISDFYFPLSDISNIIENFSRRNISGALVQVFDPAERDFPFDGYIRFHDTELPDNDGIVAPKAEDLRDAYKKRFIEHQKSLAAAAQSSGWQFLSLPTDTAYANALQNIYDILSVKKHA